MSDSTQTPAPAPVVGDAVGVAPPVIEHVLSILQYSPTMHDVIDPAQLHAVVIAIVSDGTQSPAPAPVVGSGVGLAPPIIEHVLSVLQ